MSKIATREAYGKALAILAAQRSDILVFDADLSKSTKTAEVAKVKKHQFFNMGIQEANMTVVAAGASTNGFTCFVSSFAMFAVCRAFEQVRNSIAYPKLNVKICASHAGLSVGEDGASHQSIEDISLMRSLPNMMVLQPADAYQTAEMVKFIAEYQGPVYLRLSRLATDLIYDSNYKFDLHAIDQLKKGTKIAIVASGILVAEALKAYEQLTTSEKELVSVYNLGVIKPLNQEKLLSIAENHDVIISVEEHSRIGGIYSAICESLINYRDIQVDYIAVNDSFGESGKPQDLFAKYQLDSQAILNKIKKYI